MNTRGVGRGPGTQGGAALVVVLLLLLTIILIGVSALRTDSMENRMVGIDHDRALAFQSAGAALQDAEHLLDTAPPPDSAYRASCAGGLCLPSSTTAPIWETDTWKNGDSIVYGSRTGATALSGVPAPHFLIERLPRVVTNSESLVSSGQYGDTPRGVQLYRISARGWGPGGGSWVEVQTIYRPYG